MGSQCIAEKDDTRHKQTFHRCWLDVVRQWCEVHFVCRTQGQTNKKPRWSSFSSSPPLVSFINHHHGRAHLRSSPPEGSLSEFYSNSIVLGKLSNTVRCGKKGAQNEPKASLNAILGHCCPIRFASRARGPYTLVTSARRILYRSDHRHHTAPRQSEQRKYVVQLNASTLARDFLVASRYMPSQKMLSTRISMCLRWPGPIILVSKTILSQCQRERT